MKALDIMNALRNVPDDLIEECLPERTSTTTPPTSENKIEVTRSQPILSHKKKTDRPYAFSGVVVAACLMFAVGFAGVMLHESRKNPPILQQSAFAPVSEQEYVDLELHEPCRIGSKEDAAAIVEAGQKRFLENGSKPAVIQTRIYLDKYFSADSNADYNDLEAKSYLYHMMLNSVDYYRTAEGTMLFSAFDVFDVENCIVSQFQLDIPQALAYCKQTEQNSPTTELYIADGRLTTAYVDTKTCRVDVIPVQQDYIVSDNDRAWMTENGESSVILRPIMLTTLCDYCLFPQNQAIAVLNDFEQWQVIGMEERIGRLCAVITGNYLDGSFKMNTDVETGIMISYETFDADGTRNGYAELSALTVNQDIEVKRFDPTGYTHDETVHQATEPAQDADDIMCESETQARIKEESEMQALIKEEAERQELLKEEAE